MIRALMLLLAFFSLVMSACSPAEVPTTAAPTTAAPITAAPTSTPTETTLVDDPLCPEIVQEALNLIDTLCSGTARNEICYGHEALSVQLMGGIDAVDFDRAGDRLALESLVSIQLSPLDIETGNWGLALLQLQADLPDTIPGQNVSFLMFGDVQLENAGIENGAQSFYFETGIGESQCQQAPESGTLVRTPAGSTEVSFRINNVDIQFNDTIYLRAPEGDAFEVAVLEGQAEVSAEGETQSVQAGERTLVSLTSDFRPLGPPSEAEAFESEGLSNLPLSSLESVSNWVEPTPISLSQAEDFAYPFESEAEGNFDKIGQVHQHRFTINKAILALWRATELEGNAGIMASLYHADGTPVFLEAAMWYGNLVGPFSLEPGDYYLEVKYELDGADDYRFRIWEDKAAENFDLDLPAMISKNKINGETVKGVGNIESPGAKDVYRIILEEDSRLRFLANGEEGGAKYWRLKAEDGAVIFASEGMWQGNDPGSFDLESGAYDLIVEGETDASGTYDFRIWEVDTAQQFKIQVGDRIRAGLINDQEAVGAGRIEKEGAQDRYTFSLDEESPLVFTIYQTDTGLTWTLADENQIYFEDLALWVGNEPTVPPLEAGEYTLTVQTERGEIGSYDIELRLDDDN